MLLTKEAKASWRGCSSFYSPFCRRCGVGRVAVVMNARLQRRIRALTCINEMELNPPDGTGWCFPQTCFFTSPTAMKVAHSLPATASPRAAATVAEVTEVLERKLVAMGVVEATNSRPSTEEATTTSPRATALPLHRASASRVIMGKVEFNLCCVWISCH